MGKVRTKIVKNIAMKLLEMYPDLFSTDFEKNKRLVEELTDIKFKHLKNRVAGYVTRLVKINMRSLESEEEEIESPESESTTD
ncbi:MAG: 30S ribosomal protein S17e [Candidatus Methanomethylicia archaeon]|nr:30S ribosomal protein S17e [Candidatus Methanomethylicia archaeon]MCX8168938.1 30S ribosomal protein S17e [Candidatus Methanomethylicia archaeon]